MNKKKTNNYPPKCFQVNHTLTRYTCTKSTENDDFVKTKLSHSFDKYRFGHDVHSINDINIHMNIIQQMATHDTIYGRIINPRFGDFNSQFSIVQAIIEQ